MKNPAKYVKDPELIKSLETIEDVFGDGSFYTMDYFASDRLDAVLAEDHYALDDFRKLLSKVFITADMKETGFGACCSAFIAKDRKGHVLVGRNFDYSHALFAVMLRTCGPGAMKSLNMANMSFSDLKPGSLTDGTTDISSMVSAPYFLMDGMNEAGLCISVLQLKKAKTAQDSGKRKVITSSMMRAVLDRAKDVEEAEKVFRSYDMQSPIENNDYHFFVADASGRSRVFEYVNDQLNVIDTPLVTNFYLSKSMRRKGGGKERYEVLKSILKYREGVLEKREMMEALRFVSQPSPLKITAKSNTLWSCVYDLTAKEVTVVTGHRYSRPKTYNML